MIKFPSDITYDDPTHIYRDKNGKQLISASTLVHKFVPEFDPTGEILIRSALKKGMNPKTLKAEWDQTNKDSCLWGTKVHSAIEYYLETKKIKKDECKHIVKNFSKLKFKGELYSEIMLYSLKDRLAGRVDLIEIFPDNTAAIHDIKTNKAIKKFDFYGNRMLDPFSNYFNYNFNHYSFQMSIYAYLLEEHGYWVKDLNIIYIKPKTGDIEIMPVPFMGKDTLKMIQLAPSLAEELDNKEKLNFLQVDKILNP